MTLPVTAVQILWINLITAMTLGIALAFEPTESRHHEAPAPARNEPLLTGELIWHVVLVSALFLAAVFGIYAYAVDRGYPPDAGATMALNTLVVLEIFHLFFIRNIYGTSLTWSAARARGGLGLRHHRYGRAVRRHLSAAVAGVFGTETVPLSDGLLIVAIGAVFFALIETEKQMRLAFRRPAQQNPNPGFADRPG